MKGSRRAAEHREPVAAEPAQELHCAVRNVRQGPERGQRAENRTASAPSSTSRIPSARKECAASCTHGLGTAAITVQVAQGEVGGWQFPLCLQCL